jgi:membrane-associated HD superfamily phosphohydrolase
LKCAVCCKKTSIPLPKAVKLKLAGVQSDNVETPVKNKRKKKKKKDMYAGLNSSIVSAYMPKREFSISKREEKNKKYNELVNVSRSTEPEATPQGQPTHSKRRKRKAFENFGDLTPFSTAEPKMQRLKPTVREQIAEAKQQIKSSGKKNKERMILALENTAKKMKKCNALRNILGDISTAPQRPRSTLREFLTSLN